MRLLIAVLFSALLIQFTGAPVKNLGSGTKVQAVKAATTEKVEQKAQTEPQTVSKPEIKVAVANTTPPVTGCTAYRNLVAQYAWNVDVAISVCNAESNGNASNDNLNDYHPTCMGSRGLFQIGCDSTTNYAGMFDPATNIAQAYALYASRGWQPWSSTTCAYKVDCY